MANADPRFRYEHYERNVFATAEEVNAIAKMLLNVGKKPTFLNAIVFAVTMLGILALFKVRQSMMSEELRIGRNIYQRRRSGDSDSDLDDDLDGERRT